MREQVTNSESSTKSKVTTAPQKQNTDFARQSQMADASLGSPMLAQANVSSSNSTTQETKPVTASPSSDVAQSTSTTTTNPVIKTVVPQQEAEQEPKIGLQPVAAPIASIAPVDIAPIIFTIKNPDNDPNFQTVVHQVQDTATQQQEHQPAETAASESMNAATAPPKERKRKAQTAQVAEMEAQKPGVFNAASFKKKLMERIAAMKLPKNEEEADNFPANNNIDKINQQIGGDATAEKQAASGAIEQTTKKAPDINSFKEAPSTPLAAPKIGATPNNIPAKQATPSARSKSEINQPLKNDVAEIDQQMASNNVTDQQLAKSEEPSFTKALDSKIDVKKHARSAPQQFRSQEQGVLNQNEANANANGQASFANMNDARSSMLNKALGNQQQGAKSNTTERQKVVDHINGLYEKTKTVVTDILQGLEIQVTRLLAQGTDHAKLMFELYIIRKMNQYKRDRYGKWFDPRGWGKRIGDAWNGLPEEVNVFFVQGKKVFEAAMVPTIDAIAEIVANKLNKAKTEIAKGKKGIKSYVDGLPGHLKKVGTKAQSDIQDKFDELEDTVSSKEEELIDSLAEQYKASVDEVDARIEEMKEANKGLKHKVMGFINGVIETIRKLSQVITDLLTAVADLVDVIMEDPIGFMKQLFAGIGEGIDNFMANIKDHMMVGFLNWLTGAMGPMGITIPENIFSLKGIFSLVTQVLGLGWDFIRKKAVLMFTEPVVAGMEKAVEIFQIIREKGIAGIWEEIKEQFTDLKETVMDAIRNMLITKVVQAGIKWLLSLLIPGAGFIKAIMAIKDVVVFFVESAIMLIPAITEAIRALASKNLAGVREAIERGLGLLLPLVISLFAKILGLGSLVKGVQKIMKKIKKRIDRAVTKLLLKIKAKAKKLFGKGKNGKGENKDKGENKIDEVGEDIDFKAAGENHELWYNEKDNHLWVASANPEPVIEKLNDWEDRIRDDDSDETKEKKSLIIEVRDLVEIVEIKGTEIEKLIVRNKSNSPKMQQKPTKGQLKQNPTKYNKIRKQNDEIKEKENLVSKKLTRLFELFGEQDQIGGELPIVGKHKLKGKYRESHHVPENRLMEEVKNFYGEFGRGLQKKYNGIDIGEGFKELGGKLIERESQINTKFNGGKDLSAILIHRETHQYAAGKAVHSSNLQKEVTENLENEAKGNLEGKSKKIIVVGTNGEGVKRARMQEGHWKSFIKKIFSLTKNGGFEIKADTEKFVIKSNGEDKEALNDLIATTRKEISDIEALELEIKQDEILKRINDTTRKAYESALISGIATVRAALSKSTFDGDKGKHKDKLTDLEAKAEDIWEEKIIQTIN